MNFQLLGDPHLGKIFTHGVLLHRRGEREEMVWRQFNEELIPVPGMNFHINMGDLFNKVLVPFDVMLRAAISYRNVARKFPDTTFVVLQGNHDVSRDLERVSAFDVFAELMDPIHNVHVIREPQQIENLLFIPFDPVTPAAELIIQPAYMEPGTRSLATMVFGHWDTESFGDDHNLIPTKQLAELGIHKAYTGHVHKPTQFIRDGVDVTVVGSMQPFAHGEEVDEDLYVTRTLRKVAKDPDAYHDKCLRIILEPGEIFDFSIDCLQLTVKHSEEMQEDMSVSLANFSMDDLFVQAFDQVDLDPRMRPIVLDKYAASLSL